MIDVNVRSMLGRNYTLQVLPTTTVLDLKTQVAKREGIDINNVRLIVGGRQLEDGKILSDYDIYDGVQVYMVLRLRGGGPGEDEGEGVEAEIHIGDEGKGNE